MRSHSIWQKSSLAFAAIVAFALTVSAVRVSEPTAGQAQGPATRSGVADPPPERNTQPPELESGRVARIRVGFHDNFTRVVVDLGSAQEWTIDQPAGAPVRLVLPGVGLDSTVKRLDFSKGILRSVQPVRLAGGVEILLVCEPSHVRVRTLALTDPDRLVLDILFPRPGDDDRPLAIARGSAAPAGRVADSPSVPASSGIGVPAPSAGNRPERSRPATSPTGDGATTGTENPRAAVGNGREPAAPLTVVLDPGHGGHDTGAIGPNGLMEKDVTLDLALRLRRLLQERLGLRVRMTRTEDVFVPLAERSAFANRVKADFLISLHVNAADKAGAVGVETFFFAREPSDNDARASAQRENLVFENNGAPGKDLESLLKTTLADMAVTRDMKESGHLAERILSSLEKVLRVENRGVKSGPFYVLATAAMPAVLVESAFITNPREERKLRQEEYRQRIAHALFEGVAAYKVRYEQRLGLRNAPAGVGS